MQHACNSDAASMQQRHSKGWCYGWVGCYVVVRAYIVTAYIVMVYISLVMAYVL